MTLRDRIGCLAAIGLLAVGCSGGPDPGPSGARSTGAPGPSRHANVGEVVDDEAGPEFPTKIPRTDRPVVADGDDWTMPAWARPAPFAGFFSESASLSDHIAVRSVDVSWRQIAPTPDGPLDLKSPGDAQGMSFDGLGAQLDEPGPYWLRLFASGVDWAPEWVIDTCQVSSVGTDYDEQDHLPIWNDCVWSALRDTWERLLVDQGILTDPDFRFAYVPGGFTWVEYDYDMINSAAASGELTEADYLAWFDRMLDDLAEIAGDQVGQLVFTGEDYPWSDFAPSTDLLAAHAADRGFGVRTGITEVSNFHLSEAPAYGSRITSNGHLVVTGRDPDPDRPRVLGTENECYVNCGFSAQDPAYDVVNSNLKALQLRMNWIYVVPGDSLLDPQAQHWDWVRLSVGQAPETSPDAWVALRDAEDTFWSDQDGPFGSDRPWQGKPFVRNLERWLVQVDTPGAVAHRSDADVHRGDPTRENGVAYEGLRTDVASGDTSLAFKVDHRFLSPTNTAPVVVKVTFLDSGADSFRVRHPGGRTPSVQLGGTDSWRTATFSLADFQPDRSLPGRTDLWLEPTGGDLTVRFVRVVQVGGPAE